MSVYGVAVMDTQANTSGPLVQSLPSVPLLCLEQHNGAKQDSEHQRHSTSGSPWKQRHLRDSGLLDSDRAVRTAVS